MSRKLVKINKTTGGELSAIIEHRYPYGLFYAPNGVDPTHFIAVDNDVGEAYTETFDSEEKAIAWLRGEFEVV